MTKIVLNGVLVEADPKQPLIAACHAHAEHVPMYCYHPGLTPVGSCRICQVEVQQGEMPPRVVVACRTPVVEGMVVNTEAPKAHSARRECLEFLLKNHPLDCPICDKAGECTLQDYAFQEGQGEGRSVEPRRKLEKRKSLSDVIVLDQERCILCSRCVRFFEDVTGQAQLCVSGLGSRSVISTFPGRELEGNYQGNIADVCPVGALTLKKFRFQARVWNLRKTISTCGECSRGCSTTVEVLRGKEIKRVRPRYNADVNKWWMCDTGRFAFDALNAPGRLMGAVVRRAARGPRTFERTDSLDALDLAADLFRVHPGTVVVASPFLTLEEGERLLALCAKLGAEPRFVSPPPNDLADDLLHTGDPCPNRRGLEELGFAPLEPAAVLAALQGASSALLVGERVARLVGYEGLGALPAGLRLVLLDTEALDAPAVNLCVGVPSLAERAGTWVNVDGVRGPINPARTAPPGVDSLNSLLEALDERLEPSATTGATAG